MAGGPSIDRDFDVLRDQQGKKLGDTLALSEEVEGGAVSRAEVEQLRRLVQLIVEALLTGKLASLGFYLGTPVTSQSPQLTPVIAHIQSPSSPRPRSDLVLSPEASPKRAKQGHLEKRPCPKGCGRLFKPGNMTQHLLTCSGEPHAVPEEKKNAEAAMR